MQLRLSPSLFLLLALLSGCSSGLGDLTSVTPGTANRSASGNLGFGFDPGLALTDGVDQVAIAGALLPLNSPEEIAPVVFFAFTTAAQADDGDGQGNPLDREAAQDSNGALDVYLAAVLSSAIDPASFTQGIAAVFRHERCMTCHSMAAPDSDAFVSAPEPHQGGSPPITDLGPESCAQCHSNVLDWRAPPASFDLRGKTTRELFEIAMNPPTGMTPTEHFLEDPRVNWALGDGRLPFDNVADDDHDGIAEPEDRDGVARTVPGGLAAWRAKINAWTAAGFPYSSAERAVGDITLVSRIPGGVRISGNAASRNPAIKFVPNNHYAPILAGPEVLGWVEVVFESDADDLVLNDTNGVSDIFRMTVTVRANEDALGNALLGSINLEVDTATLERVSVQDASGAEADGASHNPAIAGTYGQLVAFESTASNLLSSPGFQDNNGAEPDIFLRDVDNGDTMLVSESLQGPGQGGTGGGSRSPSISGKGLVVAYESRATDLVPLDNNGLQDIFVSMVQGGAVVWRRRASVADGSVEGVGGDCRAASIAATDPSTTVVRVAFESDKTNLAPQLPPNSTTNVYLYAGDVSSSDLDRTTLLNQRIDNSGTALGMSRAGSTASDSHSPSISPDGMRVMFQTLADNLDVVRAEDLNDQSDVVLVDLSQLESQGYILPVRVSVTVDGGSGNGSSSQPLLGNFATPSEEFAFGFSVFASDSSNLGNSDNGRHVISFLNESAGVFANFGADLVSGPLPLTVEFRDRSSGMPSSFLWDFGDPGSAENSSTLERPKHTYEEAGSYPVKLTIQTANGPAEFERPGFIRAYGPVVPDFSATPQAGTVPFDVQFTDSSTEDPTSWAWDFGDGTTSDEQSPLHTYTEEGVYAVQLDASGVGGAGSELKLAFITASAPVGASFDATPSSGIAPLDVDFTDTSSGEPSLWAWDFGDTQTSDLQNPSHRYASSGTYRVSLSATGPGGTDSFSRDITVFEPIVTEFDTSNATTGTASYTVNFRNLSTGDDDAWAWDFGDTGSSSNRSDQENPSHTYASAGSFSVTLTASGPGGTDTLTKTDYITIHAPVGADFSSMAQAGAPLMVQFSDLSTGNPTSWSWNFGDAASGSNASSEQSPQHTFSSPGFYTVTLTASGSGGSDTEAKSVGVDLGGAMADFALQAGSSASGLPPHTVSFMDTSNFAASSWSWSFGDGGSSTEQNPSHTFASPGLYQVSLTATGSGGVSDTEIKPGFITVSTPVSAGFDSSTLSGDADLTVNFTNRTTGDAGTWLWNFGETGSGSDTATTQNASHTYRTAGTYTVTLSASGLGGMDTASETITVDVAADFSANTTSGFPGMLVDFSDTSSGNPTTWSWDFGDGGSGSTSQNPSNRYTSTTPRSYTVSMLAAGGGQSDTEIKSGLIVIGKADFSPSASTGYAGVTRFDFIESSTVTPSSFAWDFGDLTSSTAQNPSHTYANSGTYTVSLTVSDAFGGSSTVSRLITVGASFSQVYSAMMSTSCLGCHNDFGASGSLSFGPDSTTWFDRATVYSRLDGQPAQSAGCTARMILDRSSANNSVIYTSMLPLTSTNPSNCNTRVMSGVDPNLVKSWIDAGGEDF